MHNRGTFKGSITDGGVSPRAYHSTEVVWVQSIMRELGLGDFSVLRGLVERDLGDPKDAEIQRVQVARHLYHFARGTREGDVPYLGTTSGTSA